MAIEARQVDRHVRFWSGQRPEPGAPVIMGQNLLVVPPVDGGVTISAPLAHAVTVPEAETGEVNSGRARAVHWSFGGHWGFGGHLSFSGSGALAPIS